MTSEVNSSNEPEDKADWPDPTPEMIESREFNAIWSLIKSWDICVPEVDGDGSYSGATGNHVRAIIDAINKSRPNTVKSMIKKLKYEALSSEVRQAIVEDLERLFSNTVT